MAESSTAAWAAEVETAAVKSETYEHPFAPSSSASSFYPDTVHSLRAEDDDDYNEEDLPSFTQPPAPPSSLIPPALPSRTHSPAAVTTKITWTSAHGPPPRRTVAPTPRKKQTWGEWGAERSAAVGSTLAAGGLKVTDTVGGALNDLSQAAGAERWFPTTGDFPSDLMKATRILESYTIDGVASPTDGTKAGKESKVVLRKIPAEIIRDAKGVCVYTAMRNGIFPMGGSNGSGVVVARLPDGSWSAPSSVSPNQSTAGFMFGVDIFDAVLIIRTEEALLSFTSRAKFTLGTDVAVAAGPYGAGAALDFSAIKAPLLSYVRSRGFYVGLHLSGQVFVERASENEQLYCYPGVRAADILEGKIRVPPYAREHFSLLHQALYNAETGSAQRSKGGASEQYESFQSFKRTEALGDEVELEDGERLRLPPTPEETEREENESLLGGGGSGEKKKGWLEWAGLGGRK